MLKKIAHRILDFKSLKNIPKDIGIEFDVHSYGENLVITHDAFCDGIHFEQFIGKTDNRFLAVNIKEEGIEERVLDFLLKINYSNFFLFDVSVPQIFRLGKKHSNHLAFRISQIEKIDYEYCRKFARYIWLDTFDGTFWPKKELIVELKRLSYQICFVSPELHRPPIGDHLIYQNKLLEFESIIGNKDLICTKYYQ